jgi:hypothetical protein
MVTDACAAHSYRHSITSPSIHGLSPFNNLSAGPFIHDVSEKHANQVQARRPVED